MDQGSGEFDSRCARRLIRKFSALLCEALGLSSAVNDQHDEQTAENADAFTENAERIRGHLLNSYMDVRRAQCPREFLTGFVLLTELVF